MKAKRIGDDAGTDAEVVIPRGNTLGSVSVIRRRTRPSSSSGVQLATAGSTGVISAKCSSTRVRCRTRHRTNRNNFKYPAAPGGEAVAEED